MKKVILLLAIVLSGPCYFAQEACGFDKLISTIKGDSVTGPDFDSLRAQVRRHIATKKRQDAEMRVQPTNYVIPVVFHLVGAGASALTDAQVVAQLNLLNDGFANLLGSTYGVADDAQIKFCLAQTLPNGQPWANISSYNSMLSYNTTPGITRCTTTAANNISNNHNMNATGANSQQALVNIAYSGFAFNKYLNIWVVNQISEAPSPYVNTILGYAPFPILGSAAYLDGVVMRLNGFGIGSGSPNYNQGRILIHEVGHYLGLLHTFQFGCTEVSNGTPCNSSGDDCCDTPPVALPNQTTCSALSLSPPNSCSESPDLPDMYENHMDYAYDQPGTCRNTFTEDQADRMHAIIQLYRANLVSYTNHLATGLTQATGCLAGAINPTFITDQAGGSSQLCTGNTIGFITGSGAASYNWSFPGGSPATITGTNQPTGILYSTPGTYNVLLNITDGLGNNFSSSMQIFVSNCTAYAGNRAHWYFGITGAVNFSTGIAVTQSPSSIVSNEASAAVSDNTGNLLFYTTGRTVWNSSHIPMPNGNNTLNGSPNNISSVSGSQSTVIVPRPGTSDHYYIYTHSDIDVPTTNFGVSQYEVDMSIPGGTVMSTTPVNPTENYAMTESQIAVPHCNGTDYWLIQKPKNNTQTGLINPGPLAAVNLSLAAYPVTNAGIGNVPVMSNSAPYAPAASFLGGNDGVTQMAISPDKKLFFIGEYGAPNGYLYYFDCETGLFNHVATLPGVDGVGAVFSPNSKVFYARAASTIRQYNLSNLSSCNNNPPFVSIPFLPVGYTTFINSSGSLQLGPDGRIYIARAGYPPSSPQTFLAVINFPNVINSSGTSNECGYNFWGVPLSGSSILSCMQDLPNDIIGSIGAPPDDFTFCVKNCGQACFTSLGCGTTFDWNFGDGYSISGTNTVIPAGSNAGTTSGNFEYPCHNYAFPGTYVVTLSVNGRPAITHTVSISLPSPPVITGPLCPVTGVQQYYYAPAGFTYSWTASNASPTTSTSQAFNTTWLSLPASLTLTVTDPATGCQATTIKTITSTSTTTVTVSPATSTICAGASQTLCASGAASYTWSTGANTSCITVSPLAPLTTYTVTGANAGCGSAAATATVYVTEAVGPDICISPSVAVCANDCAVLNGICRMTDLSTTSYTWSPTTGIASVYSGSTTVCPVVSTVYTLTAANSAGCINTATTSVIVNFPPAVSIAPAISSICAGSTQTLCASGADTYSWNTGAATACISAAPLVATVYTVTGINAVTQCSAMASATIEVNPVPELCLTPSATICAGRCTVINAACQGSTDSYSWSPSTGLSNPFSASTAACPTVTTVYTVTAVNSYGCVKRATLGVYVTPVPSITISPSSSTICAGGTQTLCASGATSYTWNTGATTSCISVSPGVTTNYTVTGANGNCYSGKTATVYVNPTPILCTIPTVTVCSGFCTTINAKCDNTPVGTTYTWTPTVGLGTPYAGTTTACPTVTTVYSVTATGPTGCTATSATTVFVSTTPTVAISPLTSTICVGSSQTLCGSGAAGYAWNTGPTTTCITVAPTATTVYTLTGITGVCKSANKTATVVVVAKPTVTITPATSTVCAGNSKQLCATGAVTYTWNTGATSSCITVTPSATSVYTVTGSNGSCLANPVTATVTVAPKPVVCMSPSYTICANTCTTISGYCGIGKFISFQWSPTAGLSTPTSNTSTACPTVTTIYTLTATNIMTGCVTTGTTMVAVSPGTLTITGPSLVVCGIPNSYSVSPIVMNPTTSYSWISTNGSPSMGFGTSANISFASPGGSITWGSNTLLRNGEVCKAKTILSVSCISFPHLPTERMLDEDTDVTVYPNPNSGVMTLAYALDQDAVFEIFDANNKVVAHYDVDADQQEMTIRQEELANGVYMYKLTIKDQLIKTGKIVIIH